MVILKNVAINFRRTKTFRKSFSTKTLSSLLSPAQNRSLLQLITVTHMSQVTFGGKVIFLSSA